MKANPSRNRIKGNRGGIGKPIRAPSEALRRLEAASVKNIRIAKLTVAIFGAILGQEQNHLFPSYRGGLLEWRHFTAKLQKDFRALMDWALSSALLVLNEVYNSFEKITSAVGQNSTPIASGATFLARGQASYDAVLSSFCSGCLRKYPISENI